MAVNGLRRLLLACVAVMVAGCATPVEAPAEGVVIQRAQMRWDALVAGKLDEAYGYLSPGSKAKLSLTDYKARTGLGLWQGAKVLRADCGADVCDVHVMVDFRFRRPGVNVVAETAIQETWVKEGGSWWYVHKR